MVPLQSLEIWNEGGFWHRVEQFVGAQQKVSLHQHRMVRIMMISIVMMSAHDIILSSMEFLKKKLSKALFSTEKQKSLEWV